MSDAQLLTNLECLGRALIRAQKIRAAAERGSRVVLVDTSFESV